VRAEHIVELHEKSREFCNSNGRWKMEMIYVLVSDGIVTLLLMCKREQSCIYIIRRGGERRGEYKNSFNKESVLAVLVLCPCPSICIPVCHTPHHTPHLGRAEIFKC